MGIDAEQTKNMLFSGVNNPLTSKLQQLHEIAAVESAEASASDIKLPKWRTLEKVTVLLTEEQKDSLDELARKLMRFRSSKISSSNQRERITANTIFRALLDVSLPKIKKLELQSIENEELLVVWLQQLFR